MVLALGFEEPNLSYVRVNPNTFCPPQENAKSEIGPSQKCHITKNMSPADQQVVNASLVHKELVEPPQPAPGPVSPVWDAYTTDPDVAARSWRQAGTTPLELWQQLPIEETDINVAAKKANMPVKQDESTEGNKKIETGKKKIIVQSVTKEKKESGARPHPVMQTRPVDGRSTATGSSGLKRSSEECSSEGNRKAAKIQKTNSGHDEEKVALANANKGLAEENRRLKLQIMEMQSKMNLMTKVMQDPNKLMYLMKRIQANKSNASFAPSTYKSTSDSKASAAIESRA